MYTKINSKYITDLNIRLETIKLFEESRGSTLFDTGLSNMFLDVSPQTWTIKAKKKKNYMKLNSFITVKEFISKEKGILLNRIGYLQIIYRIKS